MKSLIAHQLPKKSDKVVFCPLTDTQCACYERYLNSDIVNFIRRSSEICGNCDSGKKRGCAAMVRVDFLGEEIKIKIKWQSFVFPAISNLQKLSNHGTLLIPQSTDSKEKQERDLETLQLIFPDQWRELYRNR